MSDLTGLTEVLGQLSEVASKLKAVLESDSAEGYAAALIPAAVALKQGAVAALSDEAKAAVKSAVEQVVAAVYPAASDEVAAAKTVEEHLEAIMKYAPVKKPAPAPEPAPEPAPAPETKPEPAPAPVEPAPVVS